MAKKKQSNNSDPTLEAATKAHEELPDQLMAMEAAGVTEFEFFDGSVFQLHEGVWSINTSFQFYQERWSGRDDSQAALARSWDVLAEARTLIEHISPYFIRAVLGLRIHASYGFQAWANARNLHGFASGQENMQPTIFPVGHPLSCLCAFVTGHGVMGFDPHVFTNVDPRRAASILIHEALHIQRDHTHEQLVDSLETNNILHDLEINDDVKAMGYEMMDNFWLPSAINAPDFLHAMDYLKYLPQPPPPQKKKGKGESGEGEGTSGNGKRKPKLRVGPQSPSCGSGAGGEPLDAEGEIPGHLQRSDMELEANRLATAKDILGHAAKEAGSVPEGMLRWATDHLKPPKLNWRKILPTTVRNLCNRQKGWDRTDTKLSKTTLNMLALADDISQHVIQFATYKTRPKILLALDTSGSMGGEILAEALSEIRGAIQANKADMYFVSFDAATYMEPTKVNFDIRELQNKVVGGGGTNVMVVYDDPRVQRQKFDAVVVVTDGYTPIAERCPIPAATNIFVIVHNGGGGTDPFKSNGLAAWDRTRVIHVKD